MKSGGRSSRKKAAIRLVPLEEQAVEIYRRTFTLNPNRAISLVAGGRAACKLPLRVNILSGTDREARMPTQEVGMTTTNCDPRALEVARCLHRTEQPELTVLFGSRARGDYEDGRSDIDIMLVQKNPPSEEQESRTRNQAETSAQELYRQAVPVQIIWKTSDEFNRMRRSVNHLVARALRDGVTMSRDTGDYSSGYNDNNENDYEYEWTVTDERYRHAVEHLQGFNDMINLRRSDDMIGSRPTAQWNTR